MRRRRFLAGVGAAAAAALAGCFGGPNRELPAAPGGAWRQHAADTVNTAATDATVPPRGNPAWEEGDIHTAAPLALDDAVLAPGDEVELLDGRTGETRWEANFNEDVDHTPAATDDRVVVPAEGRVVALSLEDGAELAAPLTRRPQGSATVHADAGLVTVPVGDVGLTAFDLASGEELWTEETTNASPAAVAEGVDGPSLYLTGYRPASDTGVLRRLNPDGTHRWSVNLGGPDTVPVVTEDGLLVGDDGTLAVHDPADGSRERTLGTFGNRVRERLAVADGTAYVVSDDSDLVAVDVADGTETWRADVSVMADAAPSVGAETVVVGARDLPEDSLGGILALDRSDGSPRWGHEIEGFDVAVSAPPVVADGAVYYSSNESIGVVALGDLPPLETEGDGSQ
jgi:outer membrane protein assembly factor BamB